MKYQPTSEYASQADKAIVDVEVANVATANYSKLSSPYSTTPAQLGGNAELVVINDTPYEMYVLLSGPVTKRVVIAASQNSSTYWSSLPSHSQPIGPVPEGINKATITLQPGTYEIIIKGNEFKGLEGEKTLSADTSYVHWIYVQV